MSPRSRSRIVPTPLGPLLLLAEGTALTSLVLPPLGAVDHGEPAPADDPLLHEAARQVRDYFEGGRRTFDLPLAPRGSDFQRRVWTELCAIPFGQTISYRELARRVGRPAACRAVGAANGRNPLPILVPCHRVIGADGSLTGYGGGLEIKRWLLDHERGRRAVEREQAPFTFVG